MKLLNILKEIGDASAKPFVWSSKGNISTLAKQFASVIDNKKSGMNMVGPSVFGYTAQSDSATYDINIEAMGRRRLSLQLPGKVCG